MESDIRCLNENAVEKANIKPQVDLLKNGHWSSGWPRASWSTRAAPWATPTSWWVTPSPTRCWWRLGCGPTQISTLWRSTSCPTTWKKQWLKPPGQAECENDQADWEAGPVPGPVPWRPLPAWPLRTKPALCLPVAVLSWVPPLLQAAQSLSPIWLCDPVGCSPSDFSVHRIFQARILEWIAISSSKGSSPPRDGTHISGISCTGRRSLYHRATWEAP